MIRPGRKNGLGKVYHKYNKTQMNCGGWGCACCNPYGCSPRKMKKLAHRLVRRKGKMEMSETAQVE